MIASAEVPTNVRRVIRMTILLELTADPCWNEQKLCQCAACLSSDLQSLRGAAATILG
jgi:hypothetical protein